MTEIIETKPAVIIPQHSYKKLLNYVHGCEYEISGLFEVVWDGEAKAFMVGEVYLFEQEVTGTETELDDAALHRFYHQLMQQGVEQLPRGWWHSHVNMDLFWSTTDVEAQQSFSQGKGFLISIELNKRNQLKAKLSCFTPFEFEVDDLPIKVIRQVEEIPAEIVQEIKAKVKFKTYKPPAYTPPTNYQRSKGKIICYLPQNKHEALKKIEALGLMRYKVNNEYVYEHLQSGVIWKDLHKAVSAADYKEVMGFEDFEDAELDQAGERLREGTIGGGLLHDDDLNY